MTRTIGSALIDRLETHGVDTVFGIPGVHTVELYRGLGASRIRHVTPRHEQGAGFMADGYARASGRPGVALVITGPGLTNTLTPMAQARADSVPLLVVSGVNETASLGQGWGHLHELPDQSALAAGAALGSDRVETAQALAGTVDRAFARMAEGRPGPTHVEVPLDVAGLAHALDMPAPPAPSVPGESPAAFAAAETLRGARRPVILAGGGARGAAEGIRQLAEALDAPVVMTTNARGLMHAHPLGVPASPTLAPVRAMIEGADAVLAVGTELGQTDYDLEFTGTLPDMTGLIRMDICAEQLARHPAAQRLHSAAAPGVAALLAALGGGTSPGAADGAARARNAREAAHAGLNADQHAHVALLAAARDALPGSLMVGDSTQLIYSGNLYHDHDRPGGWFNAATGYGALGYGIPAAIGAALACPGAPVLCITGDGGAQYVLPELMTAVDEKLPVIFLVWNNTGYGEIAVAMEDAGVEVIGCSPTPPEFEAVAASCGMAFSRCAPEPEAVGAALRAARPDAGPAMIEIRMPAMTRTP